MRPYSVPLHSVLLVTACVVLFYVDENHARHLALRLPISVDVSTATLLSCVLVHVDAMHLWNNIVLIALFGTLFEVVHGVVAHAVVFWMGAFAGVIFEAGFNDDFRGRLLGASGGAFALLGAYGGHLIINWKETRNARLFALSLFVYVLFHVMHALTREEDERVTIADWSHGSGFAQGLLVGCVVVRNMRVLWWEQLVVLGGLVLSGAIFWIGCAQCSAVARNESVPARPQ